MRHVPNSFWRYSLNLYGDPAVATICLSLQDRCGANVNILLYCCWMGQTFRALDKRALRTAMAAVRRCQAEIVRPLRQARRALKRPPAGVPVAISLDLRRRIGAIELDLEYLEQRLLVDVAQRLPRPARARTPRAAVGASLFRYLALLAVPADHPGLLDAAALIDASCLPPSPRSVRPN